MGEPWAEAKVAAPVIIATAISGVTNLTNFFILSSYFLKGGFSPTTSNSLLKTETKDTS
jgi:hypothetical protein